MRKKKKRRGEKLRLICFTEFLLIYLSLSLLGSPAFSKESTSVLPIPKSKLQSKLRSIGYATIRTSLLKKVEILSSIDIRYVPCSDEFPKLPGDFPCNFLTYPNPEEKNIKTDVLDTTDDGVMTESLEGGLITIFLTKEGSSLGGKVIQLGEGEEALLLFYTKQGNLSHYRVGESLVVLQWQNQKGNETLVKIYAFSLGVDLFPVEGKEIQFQK